MASWLHGYDGGEAIKTLVIKASCGGGDLPSRSVAGRTPRTWRNARSQAWRNGPSCRCQRDPQWCGVPFTSWTCPGLILATTVSPDPVCGAQNGTRLGRGPRATGNLVSGQAVLWLGAGTKPASPAALHLPRLSRVQFSAKMQLSSAGRVQAEQHHADTFANPDCRFVRRGHRELSHSATRSLKKRRRCVVI